MKIGIVFPQNEIGSDPSAIRGFAQAAEEIGLTHIAAFDHVRGADTARRADVPAFYTHQSAFHEPFVLFSHLAAVTSRIGFATCILVLPTFGAAVSAMSWHLATGLLATGAEDGTVQLWDVGPLEQKYHQSQLLKPQGGHPEDEEVKLCSVGLHLPQKRVCGGRTPLYGRDRIESPRGGADGSRHGGCGPGAGGRERDA